MQHQRTLTLFMLLNNNQYLPGSKAKGGGRDEQQEPFDERVFCCLPFDCCGAALSPEADQPAWKSTVDKD